MTKIKVATTRSKLLKIAQKSVVAQEAWRTQMTQVKMRTINVTNEHK